MGIILRNELTRRATRVTSQTMRPNSSQSALRCAIVEVILLMSCKEYLHSTSGELNKYILSSADNTDLIVKILHAGLYTYLEAMLVE